MLRRILLYYCLFNVAFGKPNQEKLKEFIRSQGSNVEFSCTSFGFPSEIICGNETAEKALCDFLIETKDTEIPSVIQSHKEVWTMPMHRTPEEFRACFLKYSREASAKELALLQEYGVEQVRIIDSDSIVNCLPEDLQQEVLRVKAMLEAYQRAIWRVRPLWVRIEEAMLEGVPCDKFFLKRIQEIADKCAEARVLRKEDEATKAGTPLEDDAVIALYESIRSDLLPKLKSALRNEKTAWETFLREEIAPLHLQWLEASLEDLRAVKQWYDYICGWFSELCIKPTHLVKIYKKVKVRSLLEFENPEKLILLHVFPCFMDLTTIECFKKELYKAFLAIVAEPSDYVEFLGPAPKENVVKILSLSFVLLKNLQFPADYTYYAHNLSEKFSLLSDDPYYSDSISGGKGKLLRFLLCALYDRLGIVWDYSLVGNMDSPLEKNLFHFLEPTSQDVATVQVPLSNRRLFFKDDIHDTDYPLEMPLQKFYNVTQMSLLHGGSEYIWQNVGFASIDDSIYVNRIRIGKTMRRMGIMDHIEASLCSETPSPFLANLVRYHPIIKEVWTVKEAIDSMRRFPQRPKTLLRSLIEGDCHLLHSECDGVLKSCPEYKVWDIWLQLLNCCHEVSTIRWCIEQFCIF